MNFSNILWYLKAQISVIVLPLKKIVFIIISHLLFQIILQWYSEVLWKQGTSGIFIGTSLKLQFEKKLMSSQHVSSYPRIWCIIQVIKRFHGVTIPFVFFYVGNWIFPSALSIIKLLLWFFSLLDLFACY